MSLSKNIPNGWAEKPLGDLILIYNQKRIPLSTQVRSTRQGNYPYYGASNIVDYIDDYIFDGEYLLISEDGENLNTRNTPIAFIAKGKFWVNNHAHIVKGISEHLTKYLELYFSKLDISAFITGAVQPKLSKGNLVNIPIVLPESPAEQKAIAAVLTAFDDKIELLQTQNETLEKLAQTVFTEWFGKYQIGDELPEGWRVEQLAKICEVINGRAYKNSEFKSSGTPIVRIQNVSGGRNYVYSDLELPPDKYIENGDLIFAWSATFGAHIWRGLKSIYHYHIWKLKCFKPEHKHYLFFYLKRITGNVTSQGTGSIFSHITKSLMESQEIIMPTDRTIMEFNDLADSLDRKVNSNIIQIQSLTLTRDTLLPKLMSGQLRVKEFVAKEPA
ncbi:MAG: restriction endonuclease subunit S [Bacteroidetes bacterium]|nr:restriction endonuclease subunit S [Bacteroidota bacterium]